MSVAARARPSIGAALALVAIAALPWAEQHRHVDEAPVVVAAGSPELDLETEPAHTPHRILLVPMHGEAWGPHYVDADMVQTPPLIRDARPYPEGMVLGMGEPSVDPGILVWDGSPLANMLSVILTPLRALAGLRGT